MTNLQNQFQIYSIGTDAFYTHEEKEIQAQLEVYHSFININKKETEIKVEIHKLKQSNPSGYVDDRMLKLERQLEYRDYLQDIISEYKPLGELKADLLSSIMDNTQTRQLDTKHLTDSKLISLFESSFSRALDITFNQTTEDIIIVQTYHYELFKDLLADGFTHNNERYVYFSSSAGQIRQKKSVFIKETLWNKHSNTIMAGLTTEDINEKGGMSVNKLLAYKALCFSASQKREDFDIDKVIVVDDVESVVNGQVDFINREDYGIERKFMDVNLEITDGAGMMLTRVSTKSFQFRLPWCKGLLSPVPFDKYIEETGASSKVKDIYGKEWDIIEDKIEVILFKSQFKMWNYYENWEEYKENFKQYNCEASFMNTEEDIIPNAKLNYQYLQQLVDVTDEELAELVANTNKNINLMGRDKDLMLEVLGADETNAHKDNFQEALELYPELLNDVHAKEAIKDKKKAMVNDARAGKINIDGKYIYILPDWIAVLGSLFNVNESSRMLKDGQVRCRLYEEGKVDLMRSPALSFEHAVRLNVFDNKLDNYYQTDAIYISSVDLVPKILQADFDGDKILVSSSKLFINIVERNHKAMDIVPLEYEMGTAPAQFIDYDSIYESLKVAFSANIGVISNAIAKAWNTFDESGNVDLQTIKQLSAYNNFLIDMAKTLDLPKPNINIEKVWNKYIAPANKLPAFFEFAKDKEENKVTARNESTVNKLFDVVKDTRVYFKQVGVKFDYKLLMSNENQAEWIVNEKVDKKIIAKYVKENKYKRKYSKQYADAKTRNGKKKVLPAELIIRKKIMSVHDDATDIANVLVRYLYAKRNGKNKRTLWECFGREMLSNLRKNVGIIECLDCNTVIKVPRQRQVRCDSCQLTHKKKRDAERKKAARKMSA